MFAVPPGTYNPLEGADACRSCIDGTYAVGPGATRPEYCECRDDAPCTIDRCEATTGACTAHDPAPSCQPYTVHVAGIVTEASGSDPNSFTVGESITGSWVVDPSDLDRSASGEAGTYPNGVVDLRVRVGTGPGSVEGVGTNGTPSVESTPPRDSDDLDLVAGLSTPGYPFSNPICTLDAGDDPAIVSDAIPPTFPAADSFASRDLSFSVREGGFNASARSTQFSVSVPEPHAGLAGFAIASTIRAMSRHRGRARESAIPRPVLCRASASRIRLCDTGRTSARSLSRRARLPGSHTMLAVPAAE